MTATRPSRFRAKSPASLLPVLAGRPRWPLPITNTEHVPSRGRRISPSLPAVVEREQEPPRRIRNIFGIYSAWPDDRSLARRNSAFVERVTRSTVPVRDNAGPTKHDPDLQINRAAYRNRTDDLRITRRITAIHGCPRSHVCPARPASQSARVRDGPGSLLANSLARSIRAAAPMAAHPGRTAPGRPPRAAARTSVAGRGGAQRSRLDLISGSIRQR